MKIRRVRRYGTIVADPPWPERGGGKIRRGADRHYPLMTVREITMLMMGMTDIWMKHDAHLYLWVTNNHLEHGLQAIRSCGFRYVTIITWHKNVDGLGQYYRGRSEHTLFGVRGRPGYRYLPNGCRAQGRTCYEAPRRGHSEKPPHVYDWAQRVSPGPYLELFARGPRPGWDVWGDEAA